MIVIESKIVLQEKILEYRRERKVVGFVPTMGALHKGHLSLIAASGKASDVTVCSIFINPTQFNDKEDYDKYPRAFDADIEMLREANCDIVFIPSKEEMYPKEDNREFDFGILGEVMEGAHRPGHFNGVAQIVSKLFDAVPAHKAFFGRKDFQQYVIIKELVRLLDYDIDIVSCPIIREESGLAMSSRNQRLSEEEREIASGINRILVWAKKNKDNYSVEKLVSLVKEKFNSIEGLDLEYFNIVDDDKLQDIKDWNRHSGIVGCVAVFCGNIRLIDNIVFNL